ncbi:MAG: cytochrome C oxidase subunit IV family protein [Elusimicrobiota bacterium]
MENKTHIIGYPVFVAVWLVLLALTSALVAISRVSHTAAVWAMILLTPLKASLVFYYFMHLKYERAFLKAMVLAAIAFLVVSISMLFLDFSFR